MDNLKIILNQSVKMISFWVASTIISYLTTILLTHILTTNEFGNFTLTRTTVNLVAVYCSLGLNHGLLRQGSIALGKQQTALFEQIKNYTITLSIIIGLIASIIFFFGAGLISNYIFKNPLLTNQFRFFSLVILIQLITNMFITLMQVMKKASAGQFLYLVLYFLLQAVLFYTMSFILTGETLIITSFLIANIIYLLAFRFHKSLLNYKFSLQIEKQEKKEVFKISIPMFLTNLFNQSQRWGDTFFLGILSTASNVGIYYVALRIAFFVSIPANAINKIFAPIAGRMIGRNEHVHLNDLYKIVTRMIFVCGSLVFAIIFFLKSYLLSWFGNEYESSAQIIIIILISETVDFGIGAASQLITLSGGGKLNMINSIITLSANIISSILLIPKYGIVGAAYSNAITNILKQILDSAELIIIYKLSPFSKRYLLIVLLFVITLIGVNALDISNIFKAILFIIIIIPIYLFIAINQNEKNYIKQTLLYKRK